MYWPTAVQCSSCFKKPHASGTRQAVCLLPSCTHEVHFRLSNYPPDFSPTCHYPLQYGVGLAWASECEVVCVKAEGTTIWYVFCVYNCKPEHSYSVVSRLVDFAITIAGAAENINCSGTL